MAEPTPAPWRVEEGTTLIWGHCNPDDPSTRGMGYPIAEVRVTPAGLWANGRPDANAGQANARLIAASPDMLARLHANAEFLRSRMAENWDEAEWPQTVFWEPYQATLADISKAEGR